MVAADPAGTALDMALAVASNGAKATGQLSTRKGAVEIVGRIICKLRVVSAKNSVCAFCVAAAR